MLLFPLSIVEVPISEMYEFQTKYRQSWENMSILIFNI